MPTMPTNNIKSLEGHAFKQIPNGNTGVFRRRGAHPVCPWESEKINKKEKK